MVNNTISFFTLFMQPYLPVSHLAHAELSSAIDTTHCNNTEKKQDAGGIAVYREKIK